MIGTRSQVFPWDHELDPGDNHEHSARVMASKYGLVSDVRFMVEKPWRDGNVYFVSFEEMDGTSFLG
jgi:hypothetical protein